MPIVVLAHTCSASALGFTVALVYSQAMDDPKELAEIRERVAGKDTFAQAAETLTDWALSLTGCSAAMLRLVHPADPAGGWIPALVCRGLSERFLQDEGLIGRQECMCGRVCSSLGDPRLPFFTPGGSFVWGRVQSIAREFPPEVLGNVRGRCIQEGYDSIAIFPLVGQKGPIGSLHLADFAPEKFSGTAPLLEEACRECGPLLARHKDREREQTLVQAVERALLPQELPKIPGLDLAVAFTSASEMAQVGGDFYDAVLLDSGDVLIYVGDCCGKGIEVAGMAARARHGITSLIQSSPQPGALLTRANEFLADALPAGRFVTLVVCGYGWNGELSAAVAGHPRPLHLKSGGPVSEIALPTNLPLGIDREAPFAGKTTCLSGDPIVLFYTDGVSDSRREGRLFGLEGIHTVWRDFCGRPLSDVASLIVSESERFHSDRGSHDDRLALLAHFGG